MRKLIFVVAIMLMASISLPIFSTPIELSPQQQQHLEGLHNYLLKPIGTTSSMQRDMVFTGYLQQSFYSDWENEYALAVTYDEFHRINSMTTKYWDNMQNLWVFDTNNIFSLRSDGRPEQVILQSWDGIDWLTVGSIDYEYVMNNVQTITTRVIIDEVLTDIMSLTFTYTGTSQVLEYIVADFLYLDDTQRFSMKIQYAWDGMGRPSHITSYYQNEEEVWIVDSRTSIFYHPQDTTNYQQYLNYVIMQTAYGDYDIYPLGYTILVNEETEHYFEDSLWYPSYKSQYFYNDSMSLSQNKEYLWVNEDWYLDTQHDYSYDENEKMSEWLISYNYEGTLNPGERRLYTYEEQNSSEDEILSAPVSQLRVFPNPFNPKTNIAFDANKAGDIRVDIYNLKGQKVRTLLNEEKTIGSYQLAWDGKNDKGNMLGSGIYFVRLKTSDSTRSAKLMLLK